MLSLLLVLSFQLARSEELLTNSAVISNSPKWLNSTRVNKIADNVQSELEWTIRRVRVEWIMNAAAFEKTHGLGALPRAFAVKEKNTIYLGPKVVEENFDTILGHELVHIVAYQKYQQAIPPWLEEGLANDVSKNGKVDYPWLAKQEHLKDIRDLTHPYSGGDEKVHYHYQASQALVEMLRKKCDFKNLLRLSVGRTMDTYLSTYCGIKDLTASFNSWLEEKTKPATKPPQRS